MIKLFKLDIFYLIKTHSNSIQFKQTWTIMCKVFNSTQLIYTPNLGLTFNFSSLMPLNISKGPANISLILAGYRTRVQEEGEMMPEVIKITMLKPIWLTASKVTKFNQQIYGKKIDRWVKYKSRKQRKKKKETSLLIQQISIFLTCFLSPLPPL